MAIMTPLDSHWFVIPLNPFFCSALQSAVGFAFGLFSVPLLMLSGLSVQKAVFLVALASALQSSMIVIKLRHAFRWREVWLMSLATVLTLPLGIWLLRLLAGHEKRVIRLWIGGILLVVVLLQLCLLVRPRERLHWGWDLLAAALGGILSGLLSIGGPPIVLWTHAHRWSNEKIRVILPALGLPVVPFKLVMFLATFGPSILPSLGEAVIYVPAIWAGVELGHAVGSRLPAAHLRVLAYVLLIFLCLSTMFGP